MSARGLPIACPAAAFVARRTFQQAIVDLTRTWRNSAGEYDWYNFEHALRAAADLAGDLGLSDDKMILERTLTWKRSCLGVTAVRR